MKRMKIAVSSKDGYQTTRVFLVDEEGNETDLPNIKSIRVECDAVDGVKAELVCVAPDLDVETDDYKILEDTPRHLPRHRRSPKL